VHAFLKSTGLFCVLATMVIAAPSQGLSQGAVKPPDPKPCSASAQPDEAIEACNGALGAPDLERKVRAGFLRTRGQMYMQKFQYDRAMQDFTASADFLDDPEQKYSVLANRGFALAFAGRYDDAKKQFNDIVEYRRRFDDADKLATSIANLGYIDTRLGEYASALTIFRQAEAIAPKNATTLDGIAFASRSLGDLDTANAYYSRSLERLPSNFGALANRGETKRLKGDLDGALSDLNKAIGIRDVPFMRMFRGRVFLAIGEVDKALADFSFAIGQTPDNTLVYVDRGLTYEKMGEFEKARADYRKALTTSSYNSPAMARDGKEAATARLAALDKGTPLVERPPAPSSARK
jgi:tetratricopeptide (TPR) repeat protein